MRLLASSASFFAIVVVVVIVSSALLLPRQCCSASPSADAFPPLRQDDRADDDVVVVVAGDEERSEEEEGGRRSDDDRERRRQRQFEAADNLDGLSDEELAGICYSRGFELLSSPPRSSADGEGEGEGEGEVATTATMARHHHHRHSREYHVDAALECLRIESEMREAIRADPRVGGEVRRERERTAATPTAAGTVAETGPNGDDGGRGGAGYDDAPLPPKGGTPPPPAAAFVLDLGELAREVVAKVRSDASAVADAVAPPGFRKFVLRAAARAATAGPVAKVAGDAVAIVRDMVRKYCRPSTLLSSFRWKRGRRRRTTTNPSTGGTSEDGGATDDGRGGGGGVEEGSRAVERVTGADGDDDSADR